MIVDLGGMCRILIYNLGVSRQLMHNSVALDDMDKMSNLKRYH